MTKIPKTWITKNGNKYYIDFSFQPGGYIYRYTGCYASEEDAKQSIESWAFGDNQWLLSHSKKLKF